VPDVYTGKLLHVDLTSGEQRIEHVDEADLRTYLLGSGLAARMFYEAPGQPAHGFHWPADGHLFTHGLPHLVVRTLASHRYLERVQHGRPLGR